MLLVLPLLGLLFPVSANSNVTTLVCSAEERAECDAIHRRCRLVESSQGAINTTTSIICGACQVGYVGLPRVLLADDLSEEESGVGIECINIEEYASLEDFLTDYGPTYRDDDDVHRLDRLKASLELIGENQRALEEDDATTAMNTTTAIMMPNYELGLTPYSADTEQDYQHRAGFRAEQNRSTNEWSRLVPPAELPPDETNTTTEQLPPLSLDWVSEGAVTEVKNQGRCGCCWATSMTAAIEGAAAANPENKGYLQNLSWQQLISCNDANLGCDGGSIVSALGYSWLNRFGGITRNNEYPLSDFRGSTTDTCHIDSKPLAVSIAEPKIVLDYGPPFEYQERVRIMKEALQVAPVAMVMKSACGTISNYRKGILNDDGDCACSLPQCLDHAIVMVGYDDTTKPPSWKLKNSWGTDWGEDGYFYVSQERKGTWGLFGVLAHGVHAQLATNVTAAVPDNDLKEPLPFWAWILIVSGCLLGCLCLYWAFQMWRSRLAGEEQIMTR